jgi:hypothetical protein
LLRRFAADRKLCRASDRELRGALEDGKVDRRAPAAAVGRVERSASCSECPPFFVIPAKAGTHDKPQQAKERGHTQLLQLLPHLSNERAARCRGSRPQFTPDRDPGPG